MRYTEAMRTLITTADRAYPKHTFVKLLAAHDNDGNYVLSPEYLTSVEDWAVLIGEPGFAAESAYNWLITQRYLKKDGTPTKRWMDAGLFELVQIGICYVDGEGFPVVKAYLTKSGLATVCLAFAAWSRH